MSEEVRTSGGRSLTITAWVLVPALLLAALVVMTLLKTRPEDPTDPTTKIVEKSQENTLATARRALGERTDLATCREVVSRLNTHLQRAGTDLIPTLPADRVTQLRTQLGLDEGDVAELTSPTFTPLDAHHLESCFLLRDGVRSLEKSAPAGRGGKPVKVQPEERAALAFGWALRQVRQGPLVDPYPVPPGFALRRGSGTSIDRALVFLALLEQFGLESERDTELQGCLLLIPGEQAGSPSTLWACGVVSRDRPDRMFLFDPRLGMPIPGPDGKGIATLAQARDDGSKVLDQLHVGKLRYDVTAKQARSAQVVLFVPLTALAPRMRVLQDRLLREATWKDEALPAPVRVKLAEGNYWKKAGDRGALDLVQKAVQASGGKAEDVRYWAFTGPILRRFFPKDEGGSDTGVRFELRMLRGFTTDQDTNIVPIPRLQLHRLIAVPWQHFPPRFRDPREFRWDIGLGLALRSTYSDPFFRELSKPDSARDRILRGQFSEATPELVRELEQWFQAARRSQEAGDVRAGLEEWLERAVAVYAAELRSKGTVEEGDARIAVARLWQFKRGDPIDVVLNGAIAAVRGPAVTYELGLCKHEQAVREQIRLELATRSGVANDDDSEKARVAWQQADYWWKRFQEEYPGHPDAPSARRLRGETLLALGDHPAAVKLWEDSTGMPDDIRKLAVLWLAKQAK